MLLAIITHHVSTLTVSICHNIRFILIIVVIKILFDDTVITQNILPKVSEFPELSWCGFDNIKNTWYECTGILVHICVKMYNAAITYLFKIGDLIIMWHIAFTSMYVYTKATAIVNNARTQRYNTPTFIIILCSPFATDTFPTSIPHRQV